MAETEARQNVNLNLAPLHSVLLLQSCPRLQDAHGYSVTALDKAREYRIIDWIAAIIKFQLVWTWTLLHSIPWPSSVIQAVHWLDEKLEAALLLMFDKFEWLEDNISIRGMRFVEASLEYVQRGIVLVDYGCSWILQKWEQTKEVAWVLDYTKQFCEWVLRTAATTWYTFKDTIERLNKVWCSPSSSEEEPAHQAQSPSQQQELKKED